MNKNESIDWVKKWFKYCNEKNITPWEFDFKQCYSIKELSKKHIASFLKYKNGDLTDIGDFNVTNTIGKKADCDKEALYIYYLLGWQNNDTDIIRGETMNSFITTFNQAIINSNNKDKLYSKFKIDGYSKLNKQYNLLYELDNYKEFELIKANFEDFEKFATLSHSIGNFIVLPWWMNTGRSRLGHDYWDITLKSLYDFLRPLGAWENFIQKYYLQLFIESNHLTVKELYTGHFINPYGYPINCLGEFLRNVNTIIKERGKNLIKALCDRIIQENPDFQQELENYNFYKELLYVELAHNIAIEAHRGQVDKAGVDYIKHPETVASFVSSPEEKAAAYLHDTLEDTYITSKDLRNSGIPESVIVAVELLTHKKGVNYFDYLAKLKNNEIAKVVKLADLKHNSDKSRLEEITQKDIDRFKKYEKAIEYLKS